MLNNNIMIHEVLKMYFIFRILTYNMELQQALVFGMELQMCTMSLKGQPAIATYIVGIANE